MKSLVGANPYLISRLSERLPEIQIEEVKASHNEDPKTIMLQDLKLSPSAFVTLRDGEPTCAAGVIPTSFLGNIGNVWLFTANDGAKDLVRYTKPILEYWLSDYDTLFSFVYSSYAATLRWAKWAGFEIHPAIPYGYAGKDFNLIIKRKNGS